MADGVTDSYRLPDSTERPGMTRWEGLAMLSAGLGLAPHIWWAGFTFAALGLCVAVWPRRWPRG